MFSTDHRLRGTPRATRRLSSTLQLRPAASIRDLLRSRSSVFDTGVVVEGTLTAEVELEGEAPPTISGGTLTPGQPADFRLGPVDSPTLFTGDHSFLLEAPENATRVIFTLESVDPDVDVDLFVRFGEDNTIQDGGPVSDHFSLELHGQ